MDGSGNLFVADSTNHRIQRFGPNTAPVATANDNQTATVGVAFSYTINAFTDPEDQPLTYSVLNDVALSKGVPLPPVADDYTLT